MKSERLPVHSRADHALRRNLNLASGESFAFLHFQGKLSLLQLRPAASGARYIALDEQNSLRWHTKGDRGILTFMAADHSDREETLLTGCQALPDD